MLSNDGSYKFILINNETIKILSSNSRFKVGEKVKVQKWDKITFDVVSLDFMYSEMSWGKKI